MKRTLPVLVLSQVNIGAGYADELDGVAVGVVSITGDEVQGTQVDVVNLAGGNVHGAQIGVVNQL